MNGTTLLRPVALTPNRVEPDWEIVGAGDVDRDGQTDLIWQNQATGRLSAWLMNGTSLRTPVALNPAVVSPGWKIRAVTDLNGDARPDLIWRDETNGYVSAWLMNGINQASAVALPRVTDQDWKIRGPK
jgi:hypothetical protein